MWHHYILKSALQLVFGDWRGTEKKQDVCSLLTPSHGYRMIHNANVSPSIYIWNVPQISSICQHCLKLLNLKEKKDWASGSLLAVGPQGRLHLPLPPSLSTESKIYQLGVHEFLEYLWMLQRRGRYVCMYVWWCGGCPRLLPESQWGLWLEKDHIHKKHALKRKGEGGQEEGSSELGEKTFKVILFIYFLWMAYGWCLLLSLNWRVPGIS